MQLEQIMYQPMQIQKAIPERQRVYTAVDLEYLSAGALYSSGPLSGSGPLRFESSGPLGFGSMSIFDKMDDFVKLSRPLEPIPFRPIEKTEYLPLFEDFKFVVGETHHSTGLGKLKVYDKKEDKEYGVPITDIINRILKDWRIEKK